MFRHMHAAYVRDKAGLTDGGNRSARLFELGGEAAGFGEIRDRKTGETLRIPLAELANEAFALVVGIVGVNQLIAPILFRFALVRSGEAGVRAAPT